MKLNLVLVFLAIQLTTINAKSSVSCEIEPLSGGWYLAASVASLSTHERVRNIHANCSNGKAGYLPDTNDTTYEGKSVNNLIVSSLTISSIDKSGHVATTEVKMDPPQNYYEIVGRDVMTEDRKLRELLSKQGVDPTKIREASVIKVIANDGFDLFKHSTMNDSLVEGPSDKNSKNECRFTSSPRFIKLNSCQPNVMCVATAECFDKKYGWYPTPVQCPQSKCNNAQACADDQTFQEINIKDTTDSSSVRPGDRGTTK